MRGFKYGFFDELMKLAATAEELNAASERIRRNAGILTTDEVMRDKLPASMQSYYDSTASSPSNTSTSISPEAVHPAAHAAAGSRSQYSGFTTSPNKIDEWVAESADPKNQNWTKTVYKPINDAFSSGEVNQQGRDQMLRNHAAIVRHHETREGAEALRSGKPDHRLVYDSYSRITKAVRDFQNKLNETPIDTATGELRSVPIININSRDLDVYRNEEGNRYHSHYSPRLPIEDLRQAHTMGRSSELAKSVNNNPNLRRQVEAHQQGMGRENMLARLKAKRAGDPNWRQARAATGVAAETARKLTPTKDTAMINMRGGGTAGRPAELANLVAFLNKSGDKSNSWINDPKMMPYIKGDKPLAPWMKKSLMRGWNSAPVNDRAIFFNPAGLTAQFGTSAKRGQIIKNMAAQLVESKKARPRAR